MLKKNNLDISFEANAGRGPVDIKFSRGNDKTVVETKLTTSSQYMHGYEVQVDEYAKSEKTDKKIYVLIDLGNPQKIKKITTEHQKNLNSHKRCPELVIIDATEKKPASVYEPSDCLFLDSFDLTDEGLLGDDLDIDFSEINLEGLD